VALLGGGHEVLELTQLHPLISRSDGSKQRLLLDSIVGWRHPGFGRTPNRRTEE